MHVFFGEPYSLAACGVKRANTYLRRVGHESIVVEGEIAISLGNVVVEIVHIEDAAPG